MILLLGFFSMVWQGRAHGLSRLRRQPLKLPALNDVSGESKLVPEEQYIFMHYMPEENLVACGCGKCGTTSMWSFIYERKFGQPWSYMDEPFVQEVTSERWHGKVLHETDEVVQHQIMAQVNLSFALVRDPKERLLSSWKSKLACEGELFGTDVPTRAYFTQRLLETAGWHSPEVTCLSLGDFLEALKRVHELNRQQYLDRHFLPQSDGCFSRFPPEKWSMVTTVSNTEAFDVLAEKLGSSGGEVPYTHASTSKVAVSEEALALLDEVTASEYELLRDYLPYPKIRSAGVYVRTGTSSSWFLDGHH